MLKEVLKGKLCDSVRNISVPFDDINEGSTDAILKSAGSQIPLVQVCNTLINQTDINYCNIIVGKQFLPQLELSFNGSNNFIDNDFPLVKDIVTVYVGSTYETTYKTIKIDFEIVNCETHNQTVVITGKMWLEFMKQTDIVTYIDMTSFKAIKQFCSKWSLGLVTNIEDSNDQMTWLQCNETNEAFLTEHLIRHIWLDESAVIRAFIDPWYRLVICDAFKEMSETAVDDEIKIDRFNGDKLGTEDKPVQKLILNNDDNSVNWLCKYNLYELTYNQKSLTTPSNVDMQVMLHSMSAENDKDSILSTFVKTALQNQSNAKQEDVMADYVDNMSVQTIKRDTDHSNVHEHWQEAALLSDWSKGLFDRVILKLHISGTINQLYVYKNVNVEVWKSNKRYVEPLPDNMKRQDVEVNGAAKYQPTALQNTLNQRLSGQYFITALSWEYTKTTLQRQTIECQRRMWPLFNVDKLK